jgi:hypothetical protein
MYQVEIKYVITLALIFIITPMLPSGVLLSFDNILVRITAILMCLYLISIGSTAGLFGVMAIAALYLERNRRKITVAKTKLDLMDVNSPAQMTVEEAGEPQKVVPVRRFAEPSEDEMPYIPSETCGSDDYYPIGESINEKEILPTIDPNNARRAANLYEESGFGHVAGVETVQ